MGHQGEGTGKEDIVEGDMKDLNKYNLGEDLAPNNLE